MGVDDTEAPMSEDSHDALPAVRLADLVLEIRAEREQARAGCDSWSQEWVRTNNNLVACRAALARIRNVATAAHASLEQCLDWCANEAVLALDRTAPSSAPVRSTPAAPVSPCPNCARLRDALEACRPILKARLIDADLRGWPTDEAAHVLDLIAQALDHAHSS
jgi:hypothetical protein